MDHAAYTRKTRNTYRISVRNIRVKDRLADMRINGGKYNTMKLKRNRAWRFPHIILNEIFIHFSYC
jgi:hypothetical protein